MHELAPENGEVDIPINFLKSVTVPITTGKEVKEMVEEQEVQLPRLKILDTSTGWLNVRSEPSLAGEIL